MRYLVWIAEFSESSRPWTHIAPAGHCRYVCLSISLKSAHTNECVQLGNSVSCSCLRMITRKSEFWNHKWAQITRVAVSALGNNLTNDSAKKSHSRFKAEWKSGEQKRNCTQKCVAIHRVWSQIRREYPLNLSILISGGKETNWDTLSNCEWSGRSSRLKSATVYVAEL